MTSPPPGPDPHYPSPGGPPPGGYPGRPGGYPGTPGGYPGYQGGYPGPQGGYPGYQGGYPGGYRAQPGYPGPPHPGGGSWPPPGPLQLGPLPPGPPPLGPVPPGPPPTGNNRTVVILIASLLVVAVVVGVVLLATGSSGSDGTAQATGAPTTSTSAAAAPGGASGQAPAPTTGVAPTTAGDVSVHVDVGDCIGLSGPVDDAVAEPHACGSREANYKVIAKVASQEQCPADYDSTYYETGFLGAGETGALCLDVDWVVDDCFTVPQSDTDDPARIECGAVPAGTDAVKVVKILRNTTNENDCDDIPYTYPERKVTVCLTGVTPS